MDRRSQRPAAVLIAAALLAAGSGGGCSLFKTRNPVKVQPAPVAYCHNLTEPDSLVENVRVQYGSVAGQDCYNSMIDNAFTFEPDPLDESSNPPGTFTGWNQPVEIAVNSHIASNTAFIAAVFDSFYQDPTTTTTPRTETRYYAYHVLAVASGRTDTTRYQGRADIKFAQGANSLWTILDWQDRRDGSGFPTWGQLRATNRVGAP